MPTIKLAAELKCGNLSILDLHAVGDLILWLKMDVLHCKANQFNWITESQEISNTTSLNHFDVYC